MAIWLPQFFYFFENGEPSVGETEDINDPI